jgi:hypothetical protein
MAYRSPTKEVSVPFSLPDPDSEVGAKVARRLAEDMIGWLTLVDKAGTPQPAPVWFLWDGPSATALVYNQSNAKRHERIHINPRASLHLNDDGLRRGYGPDGHGGTYRAGASTPGLPRQIWRLD